MWSGRLIITPCGSLASTNVRACTRYIERPSRARAASHTVACILFSTSLHHSIYVCLYIGVYVCIWSDIAFSTERWSLDFWAVWSSRPISFLMHIGSRKRERKNTKNIIKSWNRQERKKSTPRTKMRVWHRQWNIDDRWSRAFQNVGAVASFSCRNLQVFFIFLNHRLCCIFRPKIYCTRNWQDTQNEIAVD